MTRPVGRIEVWEPGGGAALYTINDAVGIYFKDIITEGIGPFNFSVYSHKDFSGIYTYPSIDLGDTVKIWLDWDMIAGDPNFIGKVTKRSGPILTETGWVRKIAGLGQGEVLLRRFKKNKSYVATDASVIVKEWATDLGLESDPWKVETDTTDVTLEVSTKSYFDLLRWISDYWYDADTQIKKDFYVDVDNELVWKARPLRANVWTTPTVIHSKCGESGVNVATRTIDDDTGTWWQHNDVCFHWIIFDMGATKTITKIRVYQVGTTSYRWGQDDGLTVYVSDDVGDFGAAVWEGALDATGWQESGSFSKNGRYIKLVSKSDSALQLMYEFDAYVDGGAEDLTTSDFLADPLVTRDLDPVKNDIVVYGAAGTFKPTDQDYCETLDDWSVTTGEDLRLDVPKKVGTWAVYVHTGNLAAAVDFERAISTTNIRFINALRFWRFLDAGAATADPCEVRLQAPDSDNYYKATLTTSAGWLFKDLQLGADNMYDVDKNPNGDWVAVGSPNWWDLNAVQFVVTYPGNDQQTAIDGMYFVPDRFVGTAADATSKTCYEQRDYEFFDDKLQSNSECQKRAETLLYQLKDPPTQITVIVKGNDNILVGDRLTITIPSESISEQSFDVIAVENLLNLDNWTTTITMVNSANWRGSLNLRSAIDTRRRIRELTVNEYGLR
jgi:hypothetical protein